MKELVFQRENDNFLQQYANNLSVLSYEGKQPFWKIMLSYPLDMPGIHLVDCYVYCFALTLWIISCSF